MIKKDHKDFTMNPSAAPVSINADPDQHHEDAKEAVKQFTTRAKDTVGAERVGLRALPPKKTISEFMKEQMEKEEVKDEE